MSGQDDLVRSNCRSPFRVNRRCCALPSSAVSAMQCQRGGRRCGRSWSAARPSWRACQPPSRRTRPSCRWARVCAPDQDTASAFQAHLEPLRPSTCRPSRRRSGSAGPCWNSEPSARGRLRTESSFWPTQWPSSRRGDAGTEIVLEIRTRTDYPPTVLTRERWQSIENRS